MIFNEGGADMLGVGADGTEYRSAHVCLGALRWVADDEEMTLSVTLLAVLKFPAVAGFQRLSGAGGSRRGWRRLKGPR